MGLITENIVKLKLFDFNNQNKFQKYANDFKKLHLNCFKRDK